MSQFCSLSSQNSNTQVTKVQWSAVRAISFKCQRKRKDFLAGADHKTDLSTVHKTGYASLAGSVYDTWREPSVWERLALMTLSSPGWRSLLPLENKTSSSSFPGQGAKREMMGQPALPVLAFKASFTGYQTHVVPGHQNTWQLSSVLGASVSQQYKISVGYAVVV